MQSSLTVLVEFEQSDYFDVQLLMVCAVITGGNIFSFTLETGTSRTAIGTCRGVVMYPSSYLHIITAGEDYLEVNVTYLEVNVTSRVARVKTKRIRLILSLFLFSVSQ